MTDIHTADWHAARAADLAARAETVYKGIAKATKKNGGIQTHLHAAFFTEITALTALAQVHATLATRPEPAGSDSKVTRP